MHSNQKLTKLIAGRTISSTSQAGDVLTVTLDDGSILTIKTAPSSTNAAATPCCPSALVNAASRAPRNFIANL